MKLRYLAVPALVSASAALAQPAPGGQLFIAPSGQPFRADPGAAYPTGTWFAQADTNRDGKLTQGEFVVDYARYFDMLDLDKDGILSKAEIARYENDLVPEVQSYDGGGGGHRPPSPEPDADTTDVDGNTKAHSIGDYERDRSRERPTGGARFEVIAAPEPIVSMDLDFDGQVSRREMSLAAQRRYQILVEEQSANPITLAGLPETWVQAHPPKHRGKDGSHRGHDRP